MPIQLHIQKMKREADVIKKNEKSANDYLTQTVIFHLLTSFSYYAKIIIDYLGKYFTLCIYLCYYALLSISSPTRIHSI